MNVDDVVPLEDNVEDYRDISEQQWQWSDKNCPNFNTKNSGNIIFIEQTVTSAVIIQRVIPIVRKLET